MGLKEIGDHMMNTNKNYLALSISLAFILWNTQSFAASCDQSTYEKAIGAFVCQTAFFKENPVACAGKAGAQTAGGAVAAAGAAYIASQKMLEELREFALLKDDLKSAIQRERGRGRFVEASALGKYTDGDTRSASGSGTVKTQTFMERVTQEAAQDSAGDQARIANNTARIDELKRKYPNTDLDDMTEQFKKEGLLKKTGGRYRISKFSGKGLMNSSRAAKLFKGTLATAGIIGSGLVGGIATIALVEVGSFMLNQRDEAKREECLSRFSEYVVSDWEIDTNSCELTGHPLPNFLDPDSASEDRLARKLNNPQYCAILKASIDQNSPNPLPIEGYQCVADRARKPSNTGFTNSTPQGRFTIYTRRPTANGEVFSPITLSYHGDRVTGIETNFQQSVGLDGALVPPGRVVEAKTTINRDGSFSNASYSLVDPRAGDSGRWRAIHERAERYKDQRGLALREAMWTFHGNKDLLSEIAKTCGTRNPTAAAQALGVGLPPYETASGSGSFRRAASE